MKAALSEAAREYHSQRRSDHECGQDESTSGSEVHFHVEHLSILTLLRRLTYVRVSTVEPSKPENMETS